MNLHLLEQIMSIIAAIQMTSSENLDTNLKTAATFLLQAAQQGAKIAVLPENFPIMTPNHEQRMQVKEKIGAGKIQDFLTSQAKEHKLWIVAGTIPIAGQDEKKVRAACLVFNDQGNIVTRYDKIHLFDVSIQNKEIHQESKNIEAGESTVVIDSPAGKLGLAVCYDVRFPELFHKLRKQGAEVFVLPSAFTMPTGEAHWEVLTRARAIENQCYFVAACQTGTHFANRKTYGHSIIIDPWGKVLQSLNNQPGIITGKIDLVYLNEIRKQMPVAEHRKMFLG
jgi:nitrilase